MAPSSPSFLQFTLSTTDPNAQVASGVLPDGTWANGAGDPAIIASSGNVYIVVGDLGQDSGYQFTINATAAAMTEAPEGDDTNDNKNGTTTNVAAASALPFEMSAASLSSATDVDIIKLTGVPAGKHIHVVTTLGTDPLTDTQVDIQEA